MKNNQKITKEDYLIKKFYITYLNTIFLQAQIEQNCSLKNFKVNYKILKLASMVAKNMLKLNEYKKALAIAGA